MTKAPKTAWQTPELTTLGNVGEMTLGVNVVASGDSQFSVLQS